MFTLEVKIKKALRLTRFWAYHTVTYISQESNITVTIAELNWSTAIRRSIFQNCFSLLKFAYAYTLYLYLGHQIFQNISQHISFFLNITLVLLLTVDSNLYREIWSKSTVRVMLHFLKRTCLSPKTSSQVGVEEQGTGCGSGIIIPFGKMEQNTSVG